MILVELCIGPSRIDKLKKVFVRNGKNVVRFVKLLEIVNHSSPSNLKKYVLLILKSVLTQEGLVRALKFCLQLHYSVTVVLVRLIDVN